MGRSLEGVLALNLFFLLAGSGLLWGIRGWSSWGEYARLSGIAYVSGLAAVCLIGTLILALGADLSTAAILAVGAGLAVAGVAAGILLGRPFPVRPRIPRLPRTSGERIAVAVALVVGAALLGELYRVARIHPLTTWDAWAFWIPKAKAIYFFGGLDEHIFRTAAGPSYPIFVPTLAAMNFRFMGSADTTALAVQWWLLGVGLVWAGAGLLRRIAPPALVWIFLLTALSIPELDRHLLDRTADWPLDIFFALAALALLGWILTGESWRLWVYGLTLTAMLATKREGVLLAVCLVAAAVAAAGLRRWRSWLPVGGVALLAYAVNIPWRIWWSSRHLTTDTPPGGIVHATFANADQIGPAFHLVEHLLFDYQMWLMAAPVALAAAAVCAWLPERRAAVFFLVAFALGFVGLAWENWAYSPIIAVTSNPAINPTPRTVGALVMFSIVAAPVLIGRLVLQRVERPVAVPAAAS